MKKIEIVLWIAVITLLGVPIIYILWCPPGTEFWKNVSGGVLSTAVALIGGIPVALWVDRTIKHREEHKKAQNDRKKEIELLELLKEELDFTNSLFLHRKGNTTNLPIQPLKSDLWEAVVAAGKLNLLTNHRLLNRITSAYYVVNIVKNIECQVYKSARAA